MRYLGIDYGTSKVGVALSDEAGTMGFPREVLQNNDELLQKITDLIQNEQVGAIVFGESLDLSGNGNPVLAKAHAFANVLAERTGLPIFWQQEMFTTQEASRSMDGTHPQHKENVSRSRTPVSSGGSVDASAAALILTSYLSRHDRT